MWGTLALLIAAHLAVNVPFELPDDYMPLPIGVGVWTWQA